MSLSPAPRFNYDALVEDFMDDNYSTSTTSCEDEIDRLLQMEEFELGAVCEDLKWMQTAEKPGNSCQNEENPLLEVKPKLAPKTTTEKDIDYKLYQRGVYRHSQKRIEELLSELIKVFHLYGITCETSAKEVVGNIEKLISERRQIDKYISKQQLQDYLNDDVTLHNKSAILETMDFHFQKSQQLNQMEIDQDVLNVSQVLVDQRGLIGFLERQLFKLSLLI